MDREEKRENQTYWKARIGYDMRRLVESVFSAFKRLFGEHLMALKWENIVQEIRLKVIQCNKWRDESIELGGGRSDTMTFMSSSDRNLATDRWRIRKHSYNRRGLIKHATPFEFGRYIFINQACFRFCHNGIIVSRFCPCTGISCLNCPF